MSQKGRCYICGYDDPSGLVDKQICRSHLAQLKGHAVMEQHHILGRRNSDDIVSITSNLHAFITPILRSYEEMLDKNNIKSPLRHIVLVICSVGATAEWFARHYRRLANWIVTLDMKLTESWGEQWWRGTDMGPLFGKGEDSHDE